MTVALKASRTIVSTMIGFSISLAVYQMTRVNSNVSSYLSRLESPGVLIAFLARNLCPFAGPLVAIMVLANAFTYAAAVWLGLAALSEMRHKFKRK